MKKMLGVAVAVAGGVVVLWAGGSLLVVHQNVLGYDPVYAGLAGITLLVAGLAVTCCRSLSAPGT